MFNDNQMALLNPLQAIAGLFGGQQAQATPDQQDRQAALGSMLGNIGPLLMAAGQRMTPQQRAAILAQIGPQLGGYQQGVQNAAQARLMQAKATEQQQDLDRQNSVRARLSDPAFLRGLGINPQMAEVLGPAGIAKVIQEQAARNPLDDEYKRALIDYTKSGKGRSDPYADTMSREKAQFDARMQQGQQLGLQGEDLTQFATTGKLQTANEKQTQDQANSALFSSRMLQSNKIISDPEIYKYGMGGKGLMNRLNDAIPIVGHGFTDPQYQQMEQAQRDFVNAVLRRESGAAISQGEFDNARKQYFPQIGDSDEVLKQKASNRELAIKGIFEAASPQYRRTHPIDGTAGGQQSGSSPYPQYPDARQAPDGHWYVQQNGKTYRIDN